MCQKELELSFTSELNYRSVHRAVYQIMSLVVPFVIRLHLLEVCQRPTGNFSSANGAFPPFKNTALQIPPNVSCQQHFSKLKVFSIENEKGARFHHPPLTTSTLSFHAPSMFLLQTQNTNSATSVTLQAQLVETCCCGYFLGKEVKFSQEANRKQQID